MNMPLLLLAVLCCNGIELFCIYHSQSICTKLQMLFFSQENIDANVKLVLTQCCNYCPSGAGAQCLRKVTGQR